MLMLSRPSMSQEGGLKALSATVQPWRTGSVTTFGEGHQRLAGLHARLPPTAGSSLHQFRQRDQRAPDVQGGSSGRPRHEWR